MSELHALLEQLKNEKVGGVAMRDPSLKPPFCRQGNKFYHRKDVIPIIPPHKRYVECFVGTAAIFYNKEKAEENILNDLDTKIVNGLKMIQSASLDWNKYRQDLNTIPKVKAFWDAPQKKTKEDKLIREIIRSCFGFSGKPVVKSKNIYKPSNPFDKLEKHLADWKESLKGVKIENKDYGAILKKYDSPDTFFFLDPPYENTHTDFDYAQDVDFNFERLANLLHDVKGKWLVTINDSPNIRRLFKDFYIKTWNVKSGWGQAVGDDEKRRGELLISNYPQKKYP